MLNADNSKKIQESAIVTASGTTFDFLNQLSQSISITDIAHALSHICRFTGHTKQFYSVAQHSVLVSYVVPAEFALQGLLHDAAESVLGDVSSPLKRLLPDYRAIEREIEKRIFNQFGLPDTLDESVKDADIKLLVTEVRDVTYECHASLEAYSHYSHITPMQHVIAPMSSEMARAKFVERYEELRGL